MIDPTADVVSGGKIFEQDDIRLHGFLLEMKTDGEAVNSADPSLRQADKVMRYVMGEQDTGDHPNYLHRVVVNQVKKAIRTHVSALTDIRPLFGFKSFNPHFQTNSNLLNQLTVAWWVNCNIDQVLGNAIRYSLACGAGDMWIEYDPFYNGGDNRLTAHDPRDTIPFRPESSGGIQAWEGATLREEYSVERLIARYNQPNKIKPDSGMLGGIFTRFRRMVIGETAPLSTVEALRNKQGALRTVPRCTLYRTFLKDRSINLSSSPRVVGNAGTAWSYVVPPGGRMYPRGRLVVWTEFGILGDGPNPYWHGQIPVARLSLDPWPWLFLGLGLSHDLLPMQDILNNTVNDIAQNFSQHVNRGTVWDKSVPASEVARFDNRKPGWKVRKPNSASQGFQLAEVAPLPVYTHEFLTTMFQKFDELSETANLSALMQLRQMPGRETIEKYMEALTPGIRLEARQIEITLRDLAVMLKGNIFQFQSDAKRRMILGEQADQLDSQDVDPQDLKLVPTTPLGHPNYVDELDPAKTTPEQRAQFFMNQFTFYVAPNSMLAMQAQEKKLLYLQLARMGYLDYWTLMEMLEIPNVGLPPAVPLPVMNYDPNIPTPPGMMPGMEIRTPQTITEKLIAQQQMGLGMTESPAGRKASGQQMPELKQKSDGSSTITES